jgi:two-component system, NarL family, sensor histidine kinase UhpB
MPRVAEPAERRQGEGLPEQSRSPRSAKYDAANSLEHAETALRTSEERYRRIVETTHEGLCLLDAESRIVFVNARLCDMLGYAAEDLLARRGFDLIDKHMEAALHGRRLGAARDRDVALRHRDGSTVWAMISAAPMVDDAGQATAVLAMFTDVTERKLSEERAAAAAAQIERLTGDAIYSIGADRLVWSWNHGAEQLFGWTKEEVVGHHIQMVPPEIERQVLDGIRRIMRTGETITRETIRLTRSGRRVPVLGSWSPVPLPNGATGVLCILKDISSHKDAHSQLREQARSLALLRQRERIAMDLHDGAIQSLYGIALSLGALRRKQGERAKDAAVLGQAIEQLTETIQGIRDYISELRTGVPEEADLETSLKAKVAELATTAGVRPRLSIEANLAPIGPDSTHHLVYIAQEALSNVARHAHATEVAIEILPWGSGIMLSITDNGRGFRPGRKGRRAGDGLRNMQERANLLGANLVIDSLPDVGTTVRVEVP